MSSRLHVEPVAGLEELRDEWRELAARAGGIFSTWEWAHTWWRHHGQERRLLLHACRDADGTLAAVLPLYAWRERPLRVLRFLGHGPGDELGPVFAPGRHAAAAHCLRAALAELDWSVVLAEQLPGAQEWQALLGGRAWRREADPVAELPADGWPAYLASRSRGFREQLRRRERALTARGASFRLADVETLGDDLDTLFTLHRARWGSRSTDFADTPFQRELARTALSQGWLRLWLLELGGRPIAAWHGFRVGPIVSYYQAGRDPAYDRLSPGFVLMAHTIRASIEEGAAEYRMGRGAEPFKARFADHDPGLETVVLRRAARGRVALATAAAARATRNGVATARSRLTHRAAPSSGGR